MLVKRNQLRSEKNRICCVLCLMKILRTGDVIVHLMLHTDLFKVLALLTCYN